MFALLVGSASAQQVSTVLELQDVVAAMAARGTNVAGAVSPLQRLARLARAHFQDEAGTQPPLRRRRLLLEVDEPTSTVLVSCERAQHDMVQSIVAQLRGATQRELRLQCTVVRLPSAVAARHGLAAGRATPMDEVAAGRVQKDAVQANGSLQNLPELKVLPLVPFRIEPAAGSRGADAAATPVRVRGEAVLVKDDEVLLALQLVAGHLPEDVTVLPESPLLSATQRMKVGTGVMLLASAGNSPATAEVVALWLRFVEVVERKLTDAAGHGPGK